MHHSTTITLLPGGRNHQCVEQIDMLASRSFDTTNYRGAYRQQAKPRPAPNYLHKQHLPQEL